MINHLSTETFIYSNKAEEWNLCIYGLPLPIKTFNACRVVCETFNLGKISKIASFHAQCSL